VSYVPKKGDIISMEFDPQAGHEQKGRRPALVISNGTFNKFTKFAMVCPISNSDKGYVFHVKLDDKTKTKGVVLCDQARILDITARKAQFVETISGEILDKITNMVISFIADDK